MILFSNFQQQSDVELHFVHFNTECGDNLTAALDSCLTDPDALAVLGVMIEEGTDENPHFDSLLNGK